ncbi:MAG: hypothetical protein II561_10605, partial [Thermoguttaceae bacterium]|nr:hypothetical protein [Thermoguttaceae bacterium]
PDEVVTEGKTKKMLGQDARPILQRRFAYTGKQVFWSVLGTLGVISLLFLIGSAHNKALSSIVGAVAVFAIAFPICDFGYMLIRDENDLEMFLGNERHRRAFFTSLIFGLSWLIFEGFVAFLGNQGAVTCLYMVVIGAVGAIGAMLFFDCNYGKAFLVYLMFMFAAVIARGLLFMPDGWVWQSTPVSATAAPKVDPTATRMTGIAVQASDQEIVDQKRAVSDAADARKANAKTKSKDQKKSGESAEEDKNAAKTPPRPNIRRRR